MQGMHPGMHAGMHPMGPGMMVPPVGPQQCLRVLQSAGAVTCHMCLSWLVVAVLAFIQEQSLLAGYGSRSTSLEATATGRRAL